MYSGDINTKISLAVLVGVTCGFQMQFILSIINEITLILDIEVFVTKQERAKRNSKAGFCTRIVSFRLVKFIYRRLY